MFNFLSIFKRNSDDQLTDNEYDFNETPGVDGQRELESPAPVLFDNANGAEGLPKPPIDTASKQKMDQLALAQIRDTLKGMTADTSSPSRDEHERRPNTFYKDGPITPDELVQPADFEFRLEDYVEGQFTPKARFNSDHNTGIVSITANFPTDVRNLFTEEERERLGFSPDGKTVSYPKKELEDRTPDVQENKPANKGYKPPLKMEDMEVRDFSDLPDEERNAKKVTPEEVAEMITSTPELVIYTGAGISKSSAWDMTELQRELQVDQGTTAFLEALKNPDKLAERFKLFDSQLNTLNPTQAHMAIKEILDAVPDATLMTQNGDRNHEASDVRPIHMSNLPEFYKFLKDRTDKASLVVTAGLNGDDVGFLYWLKKHNPNVKIIASDLGRSVKEYPKYLSKDDFILAGDAQLTLPEVVKALKAA
jgi:hypothetical protein